MNFWEGITNDWKAHWTILGKKRKKTTLDTLKVFDDSFIQLIISKKWYGKRKHLYTNFYNFTMLEIGFIETSEDSAWPDEYPKIR